MNENVTWYAIYEVTDARGFDADFTPCESKEAAIEEATTFLEFASGEDAAAYAVAVPNSICTDVDENEWSLWDHLGDIPPGDFVWLHRGSEFAKNSGSVGVDIVEDLRYMAPLVNEEMSEMLTKAAAEIQRLRAAIK
jgi:hypothetical protein